MSEFTPGPWIVATQSGQVLVPSNKPGTYQLLCWENDDGLIEFMSPGDAHLVAAAPEMLAALKAVSEIIPRFQLTEEETVALAKLDSAIAKAERQTTGRSQ